MQPLSYPTGCEALRISLAIIICAAPVVGSELGFYVCFTFGVYVCTYVHRDHGFKFSLKLPVIYMPIPTTERLGLSYFTGFARVVKIPVEHIKNVLWYERQNRSSFDLVS